MRGVGEVEILQSSERRPQFRLHRLQEPTLAAGQSPQPGVVQKAVSVNGRQVEGANVQILQGSGAGKIIGLHYPQVSLYGEDPQVVHPRETSLVQVEWSEAEVEDTVLEGKVEVTD